MPENIRYWLYTGNAGYGVIHKSSCAWCNNGKGIKSDIDHIAPGWYGFYATKGAAVDAAEHWRVIPWECSYCITMHRINSGQGPE